MSTLAVSFKDRHDKQMQPDIKKYLNVYQYLQDIYAFRKKRDAKFSYEVWAKELGIKDKSYIRLIVLGKRPLNEKMTEALKKNLALSAQEQPYFQTLTQYTQSRNREYKEVFGRKLIELLKSELDQMEIKAHYDFLSNPLLPRLQVLLTFRDIDSSARIFRGC